MMDGDMQPLIEDEKEKSLKPSDKWPKYTNS